MASRARRIRTFSFLIVLVTTVYFAAYFALVKRTPVFSGNNLRQFALVSIVEQDGDIRYVPKYAPDTYRAAYVFDNRLVHDLFSPAHWLDRRIRLEYWLGPVRPVRC